MSELVEILEASGLRSVSTYIQSGNILCETDLSAEALANQIHQSILQQIGASNLSVVIKKGDLELAIAENPFPAACDLSRIHLTFTNHELDRQKLAKI